MSYFVGMIRIFLLFAFSTAVATAFSQGSNKPAITGVWKSVGDGYLLDARDNKIVLYSYTSKHCYKENNEYLSNLLNSSSVFLLNATKDTLSVYLHDFGAKTTHLQDEKKYYKIKEMPAYCDALTSLQKKDPEYLFDIFITTLKENYAFAPERKLNWDSINNSYKGKINATTSSEQLFDIMGEIVALTKDQHTKIVSNDGKTKQYSGVPSALKLMEVFKNQKQETDFNAFANKFFSNSYSNISNDLLKGNGKKVANGKLEWGEITPEIGYIHIHSLTGFASGTLPRKQHIDTLKHYMNEVMKSLHNKKAIIVDVSFNFGGYDAAGLTIASYFTDKIVPVYTKYRYKEGQFLKGSLFDIYPAEQYNFTKPVYLITTDISRSAAESFAMQMKALPNVKIAGTPTLGIISDMLGKSIGEYYLTLSNEKYVSTTNEVFEARGVTVDIEMEVFPENNMFNGHKDAVRKVVELIENRK